MPFKDKERKKEYNKQYYKQYYENNCEKELARQKEYRKNYPEKIKQYREDYPEKIKEYYKNNKEKILIYQNQWQKNKIKTDLNYHLNRRMSISIGESLKGNKTGRKWEDLVGYSVKKIRNYLDKNIPRGYTWQDYLSGKLHIDHIIPKRAFTFENTEDEEFKQCWSLYNLRLFPARDNMSKKDKIDNPILLGLLTKEII